MRRFAAAALVAGLLATTAASAHAAPLGFDCRFVTVSHDLLTGNSASGNIYTGFAFGYSDVNDQAEIRCYVRVDGTEVASTPTGTGLDVAVTFGPLTYTDYPGANIEFCAAPSPDPSTHFCRDAVETEIPFGDATEVATLLSESLVCPVLFLLDGLRVPGVLEIRESDLYVLNSKVWDCAPYDPPGNGPWSTLLVMT